MARSLQTICKVNITSISAATNVFFLVAAVFAIVSMVSFLCTFRKLGPRTQRHHEEAQSRPSERKFVSTISGIGSKAHLLAKTISWREEDQSDESVWRKTILMGGRCRPLDFSGRILYDSEGKQMLEPPKRTPSRDLFTAIASAARS